MMMISFANASMLTALMTAIYHSSSHPSFILVLIPPPPLQTIRDAFIDGLAKGSRRPKCNHTPLLFVIFLGVNRMEPEGSQALL